MRVEHFLREGAQRFGQRTAVVSGRRSLTYSGLDAHSDKVAAAFVGRGVRPGQRVAVFLEDGLPAVVTAFGALKAGAVLAPLAADAAADDLTTWLIRERAAGLVTETRLANRAGDALRQALGVRFVVLVGGDRALGGGTCLAYETIVGGFDHVAAKLVGTDSDAAILFANDSGATDVLTHGDIVATIAAGVPPTDETPAAEPPLSSREGFYGLLTIIAAGHTHILSGRPAGRTTSSHQPGAAGRRLALAG